jgi:hypothetical protein
MKFVVRLVIYLVLLVLAVVFLGKFRTAYNTGHERNVELVETAAGELAAGPAGGIPTNSLGAPQTNTAPATNLPLATNVSASIRTAEVAVTNLGGAGVPKPPAAGRKADSFLYLGLFIASLIGLGGLGAWDVAQHFGSQAGRAIMADDWVERKDPEYEKAEEEWAKGHHIDAITLMREYLRKNSGEQHVAIRIAEIYEKDLGNHLAAALELEEVLGKRLPREKWGWTAIRLANIYSGRLNQSDKAMAVLRRIVDDYGDTAAAKKARQRLGIPEPEDAAEPGSASGEEPVPPPEPENPGNLPKGFRPKK